MKLNSSHPLFTNATVVAQVCNQLPSSLNVNFFGYGRFYDNGYCYVLSNRPDCYEYLLSQKIQLTSPIPKDLLKDEFFYFLPNDGYYTDVIHHFKMFYALDYIIRKKGYYEMFCITNRYNDPDVINRYLNNFTILKHFFINFIKIADRLIKTASKQKIFLPPTMRTNFKGLDIAESKTMPVDKINEWVMKEYNLSIRESQIVSLVTRGYTAKMIAQTLSIGQRTVESYLINVKSKMNCHFKSDLIDKINSRILIPDG